MTIRKPKKPDPLSDPEPLIRQVYAYALYRLGDQSDAEDLTSDVFEQAVRYRKNYDPRQGEPLGWLIGIARRRASRVFKARADVPPESGSGVVPDHAEDAVARITLADAVAGLSPRDRELIALRYGADLSARQIAELLELRPNAVEVALHRARERLRGVLGMPLEASEAPAQRTAGRPL